MVCIWLKKKSNIFFIVCFVVREMVVLNGVWNNIENNIYIIIILI